MLNKGCWIDRGPQKSAKSVKFVSVRDWDDMDITSLQQEHTKNVTLSGKLFFFPQRRDEKKSL